MRYALAILPLLLAAVPAPAQADPYKWCAFYGGFRGSGPSNCWFMTLEQCRATISGVGGTCQPNPFYDGKPIRTPEDGPPRKTRKKKRTS